MSVLHSHQSQNVHASIDWGLSVYSGTPFECWVIIGKYRVSDVRYHGLQLLALMQARVRNRPCLRLCTICRASVPLISTTLCRFVTEWLGELVVCVNNKPRVITCKWRGQESISQLVSWESDNNRYCTMLYPVLLLLQFSLWLHMYIYVVR